MSLSRALEVISKQVGERHYATPELGEQLVALKCNATPETLREKIAHVANAAWTKTSDGWRLERSKDLTSALRQADLTNRTALMRRAIDFALSRCPPSLPVDQILADFQVALETAEKGETLNREVRLRLRGLTDGLRRSLCEAFSAEQLAAIPVGARITFSDKPTAKQQQLSEAARRAISSALDLYRSFVVKLPADWLQRWQDSERRPDLGLLFSYAKDPRVGKVNVVVTASLSNVLIEGYAYTPAGEMFAYSFPFMDLNRASSAERDPVLWPPVDAVSPLTDLIDSINEYEVLVPPHNALRSIFADMERKDPLDIVATPVLSEMAAFRHVDHYIAIVDDRWLDVGTNPGLKAINVRQLMSMFRAQGGSATVAGDWLEVAPPTPTLVSTATLNRQAMRKFWGSSRITDRLRSLATYYFEADPTDYLLHTPFMVSSVPDRGPRGRDFGLRILGSLDISAWKSFFKGNRIPLNQLSTVTRSIVELFANESESGLLIDEKIEDAWPDLRRSVSEAFPHGFPSGSFLSREPGEPFQVIGLTPPAGEPVNWRTFEEGAPASESEQSDEEESPEFRYYPVMSDLVLRAGKKAPTALLSATFEFGISSPAALVIQFLPGVTLRAEIEDDPVSTAAKVSFRHLAPEVQKLMKEMVKRLIEDEEVPKNSVLRDLDCCLVEEADATSESCVVSAR